MVSMSSFSRSKPVRGRVSSGHPTSSQGINHECAPAHGPHHGPHPSPKSAHAPPGHPFKCMLQDHSDAHEDEEAANGAELGTPSEPPHPRPCITRGHAESAQQPGRPSSARPGRAPKTPNTCRKNWRQRDLQKPTIDVDIHERLKGGGHCQAGCRRVRRPTSDAMW